MDNQLNIDFKKKKIGRKSLHPELTKEERMKENSKKHKENNLEQIKENTEKANFINRTKKLFAELILNDPEARKILYEKDKNNVAIDDNTITEFLNDERFKNYFVKKKKNEI